MSKFNLPYSKSEFPLGEDMMNGFNFGEYQSPIGIIKQEMEAKIEGEVLRAVQRYDINVNKDELFKALQYDRNQYTQGYHDAMSKVGTALAELVKEYNDTNIISKFYELLEI